MHEIFHFMTSTVKPHKDKKSEANANHRKSSGNAPWFLRQYYPLLWLFIIGMLLFGRTIGFDYTYLDDHTLILANIEPLQHMSHLKRAFSEDVFRTATGGGYYYRPVLTISFMVDAMMGKGKFGMFHFSNIVYHILATWLFFVFLTKIGWEERKSLAFSVIFLVHPMITQAVAWVPGRNDTLLAIMVFGAFIAWIDYLDKRHLKYLLVHFALFALGMLTKESAIVVPVLVLLFTVWHLRIKTGRITLALAGWAIILVLWWVVRQAALGNENNVPFHLQMLSAFKNVPALLPFLGKMLFPVDLSVFPILADMKISSILGVVVLALLVMLWFFSRPRGLFFPLFGLAWFVVFLLPSFVSISGQIPNFSEHRGYLSLAGLMIYILSCDPVRHADFSRKIPLSMALLVALIFSVATFTHSRHFSDRFAFWQNAVDTSPSHAFNYNNLGAMYYLENDLEKAEPLFLKALSINPAEPMANSNAGLVAMRKNRPEEAERYYLEEIRINPRFDHVYYNLGLLYIRYNRVEEAVTQWKRNLEINPWYPDAYQALYQVYTQMNMPQARQELVLQANRYGIQMNQ